MPAGTELPTSPGTPGAAPRAPTLAFMALWFFLVFFRNCFRLPEDTYSVMKMTWEGREASAPQPPRTASAVRSPRLHWPQQHIASASPHAAESAAGHGVPRKEGESRGAV